MPPVAPSEYPPPFDSESVIVAPTDPEDERIEVGVAIVGGGPAGLAAAVKTLQLLEDKPELMEKLGEELYSAQCVSRPPGGGSG